MKAKEKLKVIFAIATIAVLAAAQSVNQAGGENLKFGAREVVKPVRGYTEDDIEFLMQANRWNHQQATENLELAEKAASMPTHQ